MYNNMHRNQGRKDATDLALFIFSMFICLIEFGVATFSSWEYLIFVFFLTQTLHFPILRKSDISNNTKNKKLFCHINFPHNIIHFTTRNYHNKHIEETNNIYIETSDITWALLFCISVTAAKLRIKLVKSLLEKGKWLTSI